MVSSTVSAMASRLASDERMPSWPMAMPSVTVMVVNSRGVPRACLTPSFTAWAWRVERDVAGRGLVPAGGDADEGLVDLGLAKAHGVEVAAVRRPLRPLGDVAAGERLLVELGGVHGVSSRAGLVSRSGIGERPGNLKPGRRAALRPAMPFV